MVPVIEYMFLVEWSSTLDAFIPYWCLNGVAFLALNCQPVPAIIAVIAEEGVFSAFRALDF